MRLISAGVFWVCARLAWTHLSTHPGRMLLTVIGVGLGVAATIAVQTANVNVLRTFQDSVLSVAGPVTLEISAGELGMDERLIAAVRAVGGVDSARPVVEVGARVAGRPQSFLILGLDLLDELNAVQGRLPAAVEDSGHPGVGDGMEGFLAPNGLMVGQGLALELGVGPRDILNLDVGGREVSVLITSVMGRQASGISAWDRLAVMDIAAFQRTFGLIGRLDRIDLVTEPSFSVGHVAEAITTILPPAVTVRRPIQRSRQVESMVGAFQLNLSVLSMVGLLVGIFLIYNTVSFTVAQRRREVGILRAIGMSEPMVVGLFLAEAGVVGVVGGVLGGSLGLVLGNVLVGLVGRTIQDLYVSMADAPTTFGFPPGSVRLLIEAIVIGGGVSILGALGPSLDAGRTQVVAALAPGEYDVAQRVRAASLGAVGGGLLLFSLGCAFAGPVGGVPVFGYLATFCLLAGLSCLVPILMQWVCRTRELGTTSHAPSAPSLGGAIRHIAREQTTRGIGRNAVTVSAFLVGVAIMVGVMVMIRSFRDTVEIWIDQTVMADFIVAPAGWPHVVRGGASSQALPGIWRTRLAGSAHVAAVDAYRDVRIELEGRPIALVSRDLALHAARSRYLFLDGDSAAILTRAAAGEGAILSEVVANHLQVVRGSQLSIPTPMGVKSLPVLGIFYDYATDGGKIVIDRSLYQHWWNDECVTVFPVYIDPGVDLDQARAALLHAVADGSHGTLAPTVISNGELRREILRIFDRTFTLTYVLEAIAVIIAMLGIINTLVTSVVERRRELATLQALGSSRGQITALILWEAGYLGLLGTAMGLVGGLALAWILIRVINRQSFGWTIQVSWPLGLMAQVAVLALVASLLAGFWPARWAARQPLIEGLRYE